MKQLRRKIQSNFIKDIFDIFFSLVNANKCVDLTNANLDSLLTGMKVNGKDVPLNFSGKKDSSPISISLQDIWPKGLCIFIRCLYIN